MMKPLLKGFYGVTDDVVEVKNGIAAIKQVDGIKKVITMFQYVSEKTKQEIDNGAEISSADGSSVSSQESGDVIIE